MARETKLKFSISECKEKINDKYKEIGEKVYEILLNNRDNDVSLKLINEFKEIDNLKENIKNYEAQILEVNNKMKCSNCGAEIDINSDFCPKCGESNKKEEPQIFEGEIVNENNK